METTSALPAEREWLTTRELAAWLGVDVRAIHRLNERGEGPRGHRIGRERRYRMREIEAWLRGRAAT